jgi:hypothetical protein
MTADGDAGLLLQVMVDAPLLRVNEKRESQLSPEFIAWIKNAVVTCNYRALALTVRACWRGQAPAIADVLSTTLVVNS